MKRLCATLLLAALSVGQAALALDLNEQETAGQRLYREGVAAADGQVTALVGAADMQVPASVVPCANCHGRDGRGRPEGGVRPPELSWQRLVLAGGERQVNGRRYPAYSDASLARAIQEGRDPAGNRLDPAMPRFSLSMADQRNLTAYLKRLAEDHDPGVEEQFLRLGTLLPAEGELAEAARVVRAIVAGRIEAINASGGIHGRALQLSVIDPGPDRASAEAALTRLLDEEQVFALVMPLAPALDDTLAARLEQAGVPLIGVRAEENDSRQIFDPLPGLHEQLLSLADYAAASLDLRQRPARILYSDPAYAALGRLLLADLQQRGWTQLQLQPFEGQAVAGEAVFFLGLAPAFSELTAALQAAGRTPYLFAASSQVAGELMQVPEQWSRRVFLAYPFVPGDWSPAGRAALNDLRRRQGLDGRQALLQVGAWCSMVLLEEGLKRAGRDASRDKLVNALESLHDIDTGLTPPLGFGPGRRQGLAGAHVVTLSMPGPLFYPVAPYTRPADRP
ncbi:MULTISPECIES: ABC transporter substrate-binding protein [unclassified Pseudomonas]|uniref:cytochrome c/ABC transporter substrate-binding protein n=1 Tax=unclassified Pseudomonas TaxID=196821 RepID=UPI0021C6C5AF|nr:MULTISPECIES: ABC transporter substrate-binding protein [unclassified Pseudomonas]MCU1730716.1 ABC transporter substrate-binding protein [Pseudomonas sp. 20P_3.2_Bac4]MCU1742854.1 ABC transporter substrate-binding protein [Pseudomonas sp. 20P_3.2_Bac5]